MRDIGKNLRSLREQKGLKQEELAELLFVTRQTISNYENGRSRPDIDMLMKMAEVLETDTNCILYGSPVPEDKREAKRQLIIGLVVTVVLGLLSEGVVGFFRFHDKSLYAYPDSVFMLYFLAGYCIRPIFYLILGWTAFQGLGYFGYTKQIRQPWAKFVRWAWMAVLVLLILSLLPTAVGGILQLIPPLAQIELPVFPLLSKILLFVTKNKYIPAVLGALLWLFGFPQKKQ